MTRPIIRSIIRPIIRGIMRSNGTQLLRSDLQNTIIAQRAYGSALPTYTRATIATVPDFEGITHTALAGEARFKGARRVHNLITASEDMENAAYAADTGGSIISATQASYDGTTNAQVKQNVTIIDDGGGAGSRTFVYSANVSLVSGTPSLAADIAISITGNAIANAEANLGLIITSTPQRFSVAASTDAAGTVVTPRIKANIVCTLEITEWQLEETTGQALSTIPSEYVSSGVLSSPYHGANVDAVAYPGTGGLGMGAPCLNGNTVSSNVVTEATGIPITDVGVDLVIAQAATNWNALGTNTVTNDVDGSVLITYVDNSAGAQLDFEAASGVLAEDAIIGKSYFVECEAKINTGDANVKTNQPSETISNVSSTSYATIDITVIATSTTGFRLTLSSLSAGEAMNIRNVTLKPTHYYADAKGPFGYMSEAAATNIGLYSSTYENAHWTQDGATPSDNNAISPTGETTASLITLTATTNRHRIYAALAGAAGTSAFAVYMKAGTVSWASISNASTSQGYAKFNISTGATGATGGTEFVSSRVTPMPNGWYRIEVVLTLTAAAIINLAIGDTEAHVSTGSGTWLAAGTETAYWFGYQDEVGSFSTSYNATTTTAVTRNSDVLTYPYLRNILDLAGTAVCEASTDWSVSNGNANIISRDSTGRLFFPTTVTSVRVEDGTNVSSSPSGATAYQNPTPVAITWGAELTAYYRGQPDLTPASYDGQLGTGDIGISCRNDGSLQLGGTNRLVKIFSNEKSDAEVLLLG